MALANPTNARAYIRLQPTKSNIGGIAEEHIRFWRKYDDEQDAKRKADEARKAETRRKLNKDAFDLYKGMSPEENTGYFNNQVVQYAEANRDKWKDLVYNATFGNDITARLKLDEEKKKLDNLVKLNKIYGQKMTELRKQKADGTFNEVLDKPIEDFHKSLSEGKYKINEDGTVSVYDPNSKEVEKLSSSQMLANPYLTWSYSKNANFDENGLAIAEKILDTKDGSKEITDPNEIRRRGIANAKSVLDSDSIEHRTFYKQYNDSLGLKATKPYTELSDIEKTAVASSYYDKHVEPKIREIIKTRDTRVEDAKVKLLEEQAKTQKSVQFKNYQQGRNSKTTYPTIEVSTFEDGERVRETSAGLTYVGTVPNKNLNFGSTTNSKGNRILGFEVVENGGISFTGFKLTKEGEVDRNQPIKINDINSVNQIVRQIPDGKGKGSVFKNATEFLNAFQQKLGIDADFTRDQKTESNEERKKRLGLK